MKKYAALMLVTGLFLYGCASLELATIEQKTIQTIIDVPGKNKKQIYKTTVEWFAQSFVSSNDVIQSKDEETGTIIGKIETPLQLAAIQSGIARITMTVEIKNGKIRTTYFCNDAYDSNGRYDIYTSHLPELNKKISDINESLKKKLSEDKSW